MSKLRPKKERSIRKYGKAPMKYPSLKEVSLVTLTNAKINVKIAELLNKPSLPDTGPLSDLEARVEAGDGPGCVHCALQVQSVGSIWSRDPASANHSSPAGPS